MKGQNMMHTEMHADHQMHQMQANGLFNPNAASHVAVNSGDWSNPSTWSTGNVPGRDAMVYIPSEVAVTYDVDSNTPLEMVRVDGTLTWSDKSDTKMVVETIVTMHGSLFEMGAADDPLGAGINAEIVFRDTAFGSDSAQLGHGLVAFGEVNIHGAEKESHLTIDGDLNAGARSVTVNGDTSNWQVGDTLLLVGTEYAFMTDNILNTRDEERVITSISGNQITFDRALNYDHNAPDGYDLDTYVANLSRNIVLASENPDGIRGHVMMHNSTVNADQGTANSIQHAEFRDLGRTDHSQSIDDDNPLGRYSIHLHEVGTGIEAPVSLIVGNSVNGGLGWGITQHESNAIISDNVVYDLIGAGIVSETGNEQGIWSGNLVSKVVGYDAKRYHQQDGLGYENNSRVIIQTDNIAANVKTGWNYFGREIFEAPTSAGNGIHRKMFDREDLMFDPSPFDVAISHQEPTLAEFSGNTVLAAKTGIAIFHRAFSEDTDMQSVIDNFTTWEIRGTSFDMRNYSSNYLLKDSFLMGTEFNRSGALVTGEKTSSAILNNVEVVSHGSAFGVQGLAHEGLIIDLTRGEGVGLISESKLDLGSNFRRPEVVDSSNIVPVDRVTFEADQNADLTLSPDDLRLSITGVTTDSIGTRRFNDYYERPRGLNFEGVKVKLDGGNGEFQSQFTLDEFLDLHGTIERPNGTWYVPVVNWITDRLTADHHAVVIEIELRGFEQSYLRQYELINWTPPKLNNADFDYMFGDRDYSEYQSNTDDHSGGHSVDDISGGDQAGADSSTGDHAGSGGHSASDDGGHSSSGDEPGPVDDPVTEDHGGSGADTGSDEGDMGTGGHAGSDDHSGSDDGTSSSGGGTATVGQSGPGDQSGAYDQATSDNDAEAQDHGATQGDSSAAPFDADGLNALIGTDNDDAPLNGTSQGDFISGGGGSEKLYGKGGNDVIVGGAGRDMLWGGDGADIFVYRIDDVGTGRDDVKDFSLSEGDAFDLSNILTNVSMSELSDYLMLKSSGERGILKIDVDGGGDSFVEIALIRRATDLSIETLIDEGGLIM